MDCQIDARVLFLVSAVISILLCVCMVYIGRTRRVYSGFSQWTISTVLNAIGLVLLGLRGVIPDSLSVILSNSLIVCSSVFIAYGIEIFFDCKRRIWIYILVVAAQTVLFSYFTYYSNDINARIIVISGIMSTVYAYTVYVLYRNIPRMMKKPDMFLIVVLSAQVLWFIFRIFQVSLFDFVIVDLKNISFIHSLSFIALSGGNILKIIGLMMLNSQRVERDLTTAMDEIKGLRGIIPICMHCKGIRDDKGYWNKLEKYIRENTNAQFSHGICGDCLDKHYPEDESE